MTSQYDNIQTPRKLVENVMMHGFSTKTEDICRAQDIFGNAPICDLDALANEESLIKNNFYMILFEIWNWEEAARFYNQHTNQEYKRLKESQEKFWKQEKELEMLRKKVEDLEHNILITGRDAEEKRFDLAWERSRAEAAEDEIIRLKAKLYDLMEEKQSRELGLAG